MPSLSYGLDWKKKIEKEGISVFERTADEGKIKETRTEMVITASPENVLRVMQDIYNYKHWVPNCESSTITRKISEFEFYYYQVFRAPVVKDRDLCAKASIRKTELGYRVDVVPVPQEVPADANRVRITSFRSSTEIIKLNAKQVSVKQIIYVDPGGSIPAFLVNTTVADAPFNTFKGLRNRVHTLLAANN